MPDKCPVCEHKLEGILDFPRILVVQFNRTKFPDLIGSNFGDFYEDNPDDMERLKKFTSPKLAEKLKTSSGEKIPFKRFLFYKDQNDGKKGYWCLANITDSVNKALQLPQVESYLNGLEASVGKEIPRDKILTPDIKDDKLRLYLRDNRNNIYAVNLMGEYQDCFHGSHSVALVNKDIATLTYEGRLNPTLK